MVTADQRCGRGEDNRALPGHPLLASTTPKAEQISVKTHEIGPKTGNIVVMGPVKNDGANGVSSMLIKEGLNFLKVFD